MPTNIDDRPSSRTRTVFALLFFAFGLLMCWRHEPLDKPFLADNQLYYYVSERVASGVPPHVSLVDHKHALSSMLSGAAIAVGRVVGVDDVLAARLLSMAVAAGTVSAVWLLTLELSGTVVGAHVAGFVMLWFDEFLAQGAQGVRPKVFMACFMVLALLAFARGRLARSGLYATLSYLCWQPALLVLAALAGAVTPRADRWRSWLLLGAGSAAALLGYEAYFAWHGALGEQIRQSYLMAGDTSAYEFAGFASGMTFLLEIGKRRATSWPVPSGLLLAALACGWAWLLVRPRRVLALLAARRDMLALVLALHAVLAFTLADHQAYPDRFFVEPYVAVVWGAVVGGLWAVVSRRLGRPAALEWLRPVGWALMLVVAVALATSKPGRFAERRAGLAEQRRLAAEVASLEEEYGSVWVIGSLHLLGLARMTNYSSAGLFIDPRVRAYLRYEEHPGDFHPPTRSPDAKPAAIVATRVNERGLMRWIDRDYHRTHDNVFEEAKIRVWLRNDLEERAVSERRWPRPSTCGDPIGDRSMPGGERPVTATDALALLRAAAGSLDCPPCACDLDASGRVSASDALRLLRLALGAKLELRCPRCAEGDP